MKPVVLSFLIGLCVMPVTADKLSDLTASLQVPSGFRIEVFVDQLPGARSMTWGAAGTLFVGTREEGKVYAIPKAASNRPGKPIVIAESLDMPNGVAFLNGSLYVAEVSRILRFDQAEERLGQPMNPAVVRSDLPTDHSHGWKFIRFGPDGQLYIPVGAPCNVCLSKDPYASILRMKPEGGAYEVYARGIRNSVGFDWDPLTQHLWFTDNGRDRLGDDKPSDELNRATKAGMHFGFPYCHAGSIADPDFGRRRPCSAFTPPVRKLGPHVAALGMRFYTGSMFPELYRNQILIAEHGSWNRTKKIGYRLMLVRLDKDRKAGSYEPLVQGWLKDESVWGRPVDVEQMPDGSILISDDFAGAIYRLSFKQ